MHRQSRTMSRYTVRFGCYRLSVFTQWFHKSDHLWLRGSFAYTSVNVKLNTFHAGFFPGPFEMRTEKHNTSACLWLNEFALQSALLIPFKLVNCVEMLKQLAPEQIQQFLLGEGFCGWQIVALVGSGGQSTQIKYLSKSTDTYTKILLQ